MDENPFLLFKSFSDELDPKKLQQKFLDALLKLQDKIKTEKLKP